LLGRAHDRRHAVRYGFAAERGLELEGSAHVQLATCPERLHRLAARVHLDHDGARRSRLRPASERNQQTLALALALDEALLAFLALGGFRGRGFAHRTGPDAERVGEPDIRVGEEQRPGELPGLGDGEEELQDAVLSVEDRSLGLLEGAVRFDFRRRFRFLFRWRYALARRRAAGEERRRADRAYADAAERRTRF